MKNFIQKNFTTIVLVITLLSFFTLTFLMSYYHDYQFYNRIEFHFFVVRLVLSYRFKVCYYYVIRVRDNT